MHWRAGDREKTWKVEIPHFAGQNLLSPSLLRLRFAWISPSLLKSRPKIEMTWVNTSAHTGSNEQLDGVTATMTINRRK